MTNHTTTDYGTWNNYNRFETSPMASVLAALSGSDTEWLDRMDAAGAIDSICSDFCSTISDALPDGIVLTGDHFIGPYPYSEEGGEAIERAIEIAGDQLTGIMQRHDVDLTITAPAHDITRPTVNRIQEILNESAGLVHMERIDGGNLRYRPEGDTLSASDIHDAWASITPDDNDGYIDDEETKVVMGAIMGSADLWVSTTTTDQLDMDTLTTIEAGIAHGNRVQLTIRHDRTITAHEHVGQGWIEVTDGHTLGWVVGPGHDMNDFRAWRFAFDDVLAQSIAGTFDLEYAVYGTAK